MSAKEHMTLLLIDVAFFGWTEAAWFDEARKGGRCAR